mmetsp:Transcript_109622/g.163877  ORF Transcript_109622/g.163877 Transcript_109622/m.163877 type:complete len:460 (-) Transcript_109622:48-1427(-)
MSKLKSAGLVIAAGTYDGVLAGWEFKEKGLELTFATAVHTGSIRSLSITSSPSNDAPGSLLSCGYDETLRTHDWHKRLTSSGEIRTPSDFGTPLCSSFAPPLEANSSHCVVGFSNGKICIYKKRDWSVQHVLPGHEGGVGDIAVHPTGKLALSGGSSDGKLKLWDLTKGRLAFVNNINPSSTFGGKARFDPIASLVWSRDGEFYALAHGSHITVREVASGKGLLDVDLPSKVNQVTLMTGPEGLFVVAACNDGSLPVLAVEDSDVDSRRAIMAIEPVESHVAGVERFKCVVCVRDYYVVTSNSAGVVSILDLKGAVKMIMSGEDEEQSENGSSDDDDDDNEGSDDDDEAEVELAVDFLESIQLGTGARITCLTAWCRQGDIEEYEPETIDEIPVVEEEADEHDVEDNIRKESLKRKQESLAGEMMDDKAMKRARSLVEKARNLKQKKDKKKKKKIKSKS